MGTIFSREFKSYFTSPIGAAILAIFFFFSGLFFCSYFSYGIADLSGVFSTLFIIIMVVIPILTMRLFSEDKRQKTDQLLFTAPVSITSIALGKFFAAFSVFAVANAILVVFQIIVTFFISPDWMVFLGNLLGTLLYGAALIAIGLFISALTESQVVAAIITFAIELVLLLIDSLTSFLNIAWVTKIVGWISFSERYNSFTSGTLDYSNIVFFASICALFIFLTVRVIDRKRYA